MTAELLLTRLHGVRRTGQSSWRADCPNLSAHDHGAHGGLSVTVGDDGRLLLHCFGCGDVHGILAALGLSMGDLYPQRLCNLTPAGCRQARAEFRRSSWGAALRTLGRESVVIEVAAAMLDRGEPLNPDDHDRLTLARQRIEDARTLLA